MKLPKMTALQGLGFNQALYFLNDQDSKKIIHRGILPAAVSLEDKKYSDRVVKMYCHDLPECTGKETCHDMQYRIWKAIKCIKHRKLINQYFREQNISDPGDHSGAVTYTQKVESSCQFHYNKNDCYLVE